MFVRWSFVSDRHCLPAKGKAVERLNIHGDTFIFSNILNKSCLSWNGVPTLEPDGSRTIIDRSALRCATNTTGQIKIKEAVLAGELCQQQNRHDSGERSRKRMLEREEMLKTIQQVLDESSYKQVKKIYYLMMGMRMAQEKEEYERED